MKIYQAGPLFTQAEQQFNRALAEALRAAGHQVFVPQEHDQAPGYPAKIFASDLRGLDEAGAVVAVLDGTDVDSGTAWECGYAYARAKPIFGLRTDVRTFRGDEKVNLMVQVPCRVLASTIEELLQALTQYQKREDTVAQSLSPEVRQLLDRPNFAHLATLMSDGSPLSTPVWVGREGDRVLVCTSEGSLKAKNTRRDPRIALSIVDMADPYMEAQLRGRIVERRPDPELRIMDPISQKYIGKPFPMRSYEGRLALVIEVDKARYLKLPFQHTPPAPGGAAKSRA